MAYNNTRYRYRQPNIITPPKVTPIQPVAQVAPIERVQPVSRYTSLTERKNKYKQLQQDKQTQTFLANYNDPTELNSYIDALTNREAVAKKFGDTWATISTTAGTVSLIADIASIVLTAAGWIASALLPDAGAIGVAGQAAGTAIKAGAAVSKGAKAVSVIDKATKVAKTVSKIAAIPAIPAALDVTYEKGIKPILAGKPDEAGLNMLMNLGETMDRYTNPIKGLILEGPEGFVKGTGLSKEGRVNYDYDTGFFLTDMLLEVITDPMNVLQVTGKIGQKAAIKATVKTTAQTLTNNIDNVIRTGAVKGFKSITEEGSERIFKTVNKATVGVSTEWAEAAADGFRKQAKELAVKIKGKPFILLSKTEQEEVIKIAKERLLEDGRNKIQNALVQALHKEFPEATAEEIEILLKKSGKNFANNSALQSAREIIDNIELDTLSSQIVKSTSALINITDASDAWMVKNAMLTSGYGLGVELVKDGIKASKIWASNIAIRSLKDAKAFNPVSGLDIKKYADAKKLWEASYNYVYEITGEKSVRDMAAFQEFVNQQFSRDKQFITLVMQNSTDTIKRSGQLEGQFNTLYQCTFKDYVGFIKGINDAENRAFNEYVKYLEHTLEVLGDHATRQGAGETIKTVQSLFNIKDMSPDNIVLKLQDAIKNTDSPIELVEKLYTIKMNDAYVNSLLINDPRISEVLMEINSSEKVGALLDKISGDLNALAPEVAAQIPVAVRTIKEAGASFANIKELYTEIAGTNFAKVKGITNNDFRKYTIDQIFGLKTKSVIELLAEFDSITMPSLKNGLEVLLYDKGFKFADYPALEDQIAGIYKRFLEAQQSAGLKEVNATIVQDFTKSIDDLIQYMPKYADELQELSIANIQIKTTLDFIRNKNFTLLESVFTTKETIFGILNQRQLTDAGLALKTVSIKRNLDLFNLPKEWSGNLIKSADRLGASLNHLMESLAQYSVVFDETVSTSLNNAYMAFRKQFIDSLAYSEFEKYPAFQYLRKTTNPIEQFAQLVEFNKLAKDSTDSKIFKDILSKTLDTITYLNVMNPSKLLVTDFAWSPMAQSAWVAKTQFNEDMVNAINLYRNFDLSVQKGVADFRELQNTLSTHKLDRVKALQNERYIRTLSRYTDGFNELKTYYDGLFDKDLAKSQLENVREVLINFPELNAKYSTLVDDLENFWNGEKEFIQSAKYLKNTPEFIDEFTPFYRKIQEMNNEIHETIKNSNQDFYFNNINPWDPVKKQQELNRLISKATDANAKGSLYNLFNQTSEEFINELAYRNRFITFSEADVADHKLNGMFNKFKNALPETVYLHHDVKNHRYWIVLKNSKDLKLTQTGRQVYLNGNPVLRLQKPKRFDEFIMVDEYIGPEGPKLTEMLNHLNDDLYELTGTPLGDSQGEYLTKEMLEDIYIQMPQEVRDALPKLKEWTDKQFFEACRFNESIIGSAASKRELGLYSTNQIINTRNALQSAVGYLKPKNEYINAVFNSSLSINSPNSIWAQFTDEELLEALQITDEYKLVALVNDSKYGVKTREIIPSSVEAIKKAKELGAVIIPQQTYKDMYNVVNHRLGSNGFMKLWSRIIYCYKFGYLLNPAAWIRNWIDTNLKSRFALGDEADEYQKRARDTLADIQDMSDAVSAAIKDQQNLAFKRAETEYLDLARDIFEDKDRIEKFIQRRSRDGIIREEEIKKWFADPNNKKRILTYESYKELRDDFLSQGVSGNVMADLYKGSGGDAWNTFTQLTGNIVEFGNKFENTHRLAQYLYELDHGETYTTALSKIAKTHFDYSFKTKAEQLAEMVFPFTTFSLRNASYWIEMIEKHPWIMRNYVHLMKPSWDFKDYTPAELARDRRAQAQILYGQVKLGEFNDKVLTFKINPSIQDALQMFSDPINNVYNKLAAPIAAVRDAIKGEEVNIINTLPIAGPIIQNVQKTIQTGSPLPSLIGVNKKYQRFKSTKWSNPNLSGTDKYTDSTYRTPKYRKNVVYDAYTTKGITRYRTNFYPIIDIAHDIKMRYSVNVYNRIKNRIKTDVYQGIRYRIKLDANRFR